VRGLVLAVILGLTAGSYGQSAKDQSSKVQDVPLPKGVTRAMLMPATTITFNFERAELKPPVWGFEINNDGVGRYYERDAVDSTDMASNRWQEIHVSAAMLTALKAGLDRSSDACETKTKNIAQTGKKTLIYWQGDVPYKCEFNYSDDASVMKTADAFQAMAETMQFGDRLQREHRYDRLGLDAEMTSLVSEVKAGRAIEVQNIAAVLTSIVQDDRVIERVRRAAARLLEDAGVDGAAKGAGQ
jgi:hypothetical protein